jgi:hypothetical protein
MAAALSYTEGGAAAHFGAGVPPWMTAVGRPGRKHGADRTVGWMGDRRR